MKIAIPTTRDNQVDAHFGHCDRYTVFTINDHNTILTTDNLDSPAGCGCKSNIAGTLKEIGVTVLLAGNMGNGAVNVINNQGIKVIRGCSGEVTTVIENYLGGKIGDSGETCSHHEDGHTCNHG